MILDKRLSEWAEQHGLRAKGQVGFCKDYRTIDQLFILQTLIEHNKAKKKPLYSCFVDFKKAFDTMLREMLWQVLAGLKVEGLFCDAYRRCMPRIPYTLTTQVRVSPPTLGVNKV